MPVETQKRHAISSTPFLIVSFDVAASSICSAWEDRLAVQCLHMVEGGGSRGILNCTCAICSGQLVQLSQPEQIDELGEETECGFR